MLAVVGILLGHMRKRFRTTGKPTSFAGLFVLSAWGAISALFLAVVVGILTTGQISGQHFAEGLFFEGAVFLFLASREINRQHARSTKRAWFYALFAVAWIAVGVNSLYFEPWNLQVKHYVIETDRLTGPLRIVFIADVQTDQIGLYEQRALELAKSQKADLILFGGDYLQYDKNGSTTGRADLARLLQAADLQAPLGVFAVSGNHEMFNPGWEKPFEVAGIDVSTESRSLILTRTGDLTGNDQIRLTLLSCADSCLNSDKTFYSELESDRPLFHIMLGHDPSYTGGPTGANLHLAGHTHGGQVCIPCFGPIITLTHGIPRSWGHGKTILPDGRILIVSNGVGMERGDAPRIRFHCPPQIVVIDLVGSR